MEDKRLLSHHRVSGLSSEVQVDLTVDEMGVLLSIPPPEDMGKVIGRQGSTAKSLRYYASSGNETTPE